MKVSGIASLLIPVKFLLEGFYSSYQSFSCLLFMMLNRTYYFYEFGRDDQHVALVAAVSSGKVSNCYLVKS